MESIRLPSEIVIKILKYVGPDSLQACRKTCRQWRDVVDTYIYTNEKLWKKYCKLKFSRTYVKAKANAQENMSYFQLYKSLTLWNSLSKSKVQIKRLNLDISGKICNLQLGQYGYMKVHGAEYIYTYNYLNDRTDNAPIIKGNYLHYAENLFYFVTLTTNFQLIVNFKDSLQPLPGRYYYVINDVASFTIKDTQIYVMTNNKEFECFSFERGIMQNSYLPWPQVSHIWSIKDYLVFFTENYPQRHNSGLLCRFTTCNPFFLCIHYLHGFYYNIGLKVNEIWLSPGLFPLVTCVHSYNNLIFVGTESGVLKVFRKNPENSYLGAPIKTITLMEYTRCPSISAILSINIIEEINGHRMLVLTPYQVFMIMFTHESLL